MSSERKKLALISVFHKTGIAEFAHRLHEMGWDLMASEGTARHLAEHGLPVRDVAELVGGGAILGHRVVTLSREIHAGLLAEDNEKDNAELTALGLPRIDLVCVDFYPLMETMLKMNVTDDMVTEKTDIGGPTILRAAAKGRRIVISGTKQREMVLDWLEAGCPGREAMLNHLAANAEAVCAVYGLLSAHYWSRGEICAVVASLEQNLKYGENPWQNPAGLYSMGSPDPLALPKFTLQAGSALGWCNYTDLDRLLQTLTHIAAGLRANDLKDAFIAVGVKHGNPCGASQSVQSAVEAIRRMANGDRRAIFGGSVMVNFKMTLVRARALLRSGMPKGRRRKLDLIVAPSFTAAAQKVLTKKGCRLVCNPALDLKECEPLNHQNVWRSVRGGQLIQPSFSHVLNLSSRDLQVIGQEQKTRKMKRDLILAWAVGATSNSNTVCLVKNGMLIGNGCGQQDRVTAARHATEKACDAGHDTNGAVGYSDSFFPFADALLALESRGVKTIVTCSGSVNDDCIKKTAERLGVTLYMFPHVQTRGFFGH